MEIEIQNAGPNVDNQRIKQFEQTTGIKLPGDYHDFLLRNNGGHPVNSRFEIPELRDDALVSYFYAIDGTRGFSLEDQLAEWKSEMPAGFLPIANDPGGAIILMSTKGKRKNRVYLWDHQHRYLQSSHKHNTYLVAQSFSEFIASLKTDDGPSRWDDDVPEAAELFRQTLAHAGGMLPMQMARLATEFAQSPNPSMIVAQLLRELFDHESSHVRRVAVLSCQRIREFQVPGLQEALVRKLADPDWWVRYDAARTIREAGYDDDQVRKALTLLADEVKLPEAEAELQKRSNAELSARVQARKALDALESK